MHSDKFIEFTNPFVRKTTVLVLSLSIAAYRQQHAHIDQDSPVFPGNPYGVQAIVTGTSSDLRTGIGNDTKRGMP